MGNYLRLFLRGVKALLPFLWLFYIVDCLARCLERCRRFRDYQWTFGRRQQALRCGAWASNQDPHQEKDILPQCRKGLISTEDLGDIPPQSQLPRTLPKFMWPQPQKDQGLAQRLGGIKTRDFYTTDNQDSLRFRKEKPDSKEAPHPTESPALMDAIDPSTGRMAKKEPRGDKKEKGPFLLEVPECKSHTLHRDLRASVLKPMARRGTDIPFGAHPTKQKKISSLFAECLDMCLVCGRVFARSIYIPPDLDLTLEEYDAAPHSVMPGPSSSGHCGLVNSPSSQGSLELSPSAKVVVRTSRPVQGVVRPSTTAHGDLKPSTYSSRRNTSSTMTLRHAKPERRAFRPSPSLEEGLRMSLHQRVFRYIKTAKSSMRYAPSKQQDFITAPIDQGVFKDRDPAPTTTPQGSLKPLTSALIDLDIFTIRKLLSDFPAAQGALETSPSAPETRCLLPSIQKDLRISTSIQGAEGFYLSFHGPVVLSIPAQWTFTPFTSEDKTLRSHTSPQSDFMGSKSRKTRLKLAFFEKQDFRPYPEDLEGFIHLPSTKSDPSPTNSPREKPTPPTTDQGTMDLSAREKLKELPCSKWAREVSPSVPGAQCHFPSPPRDLGLSTSLQGAEGFCLSFHGPVVLSTPTQWTFTPFRSEEKATSPQSYSIGSNSNKTRWRLASAEKKDVRPYPKDLESFIKFPSVKREPSPTKTPQEKPTPLTSDQGNLDLSTRENLESLPSVKGGCESSPFVPGVLGHFSSPPSDVGRPTYVQGALGLHLSFQTPVILSRAAQRTFIPFHSDEGALISYTSPHSVSVCSKSKKTRVRLPLFERQGFRPYPNNQEALELATSPQWAIKCSTFQEGPLRTSVYTQCTHTHSKYAQGALKLFTSAQEGFRPIFAHEWGFKLSTTTLGDTRNCNTIRRCRHAVCYPGEFSTFLPAEKDFNTFSIDKRELIALPLTKKSQIPTTVPQANITHSTFTQQTLQPSTFTQGPPENITSIQEVVECSTFTQGTLEPFSSSQGSLGMSLSRKGSWGMERYTHNVLNTSAFSRDISGTSKHIQRNLGHHPYASLHPSLISKEALGLATYAKRDVEFSSNIEEVLENTSCTQGAQGPCPFGKKDVATSLFDKECLGNVTCIQEVIDPSFQESSGPSTFMQGSLVPSPSAAHGRLCIPSVQGELEMATNTQSSPVTSVISKGSLGLVTSIQGFLDTYSFDQGNGGTSIYLKESLEPSPSNQNGFNPTPSDQDPLRQAPSTQRSLPASPSDKGDIGPLKDRQGNLGPSLSVCADLCSNLSTPGHLGLSISTQQYVQSCPSAEGGLEISKNTRGALESSSSKQGFVGTSEYTQEVPAHSSSGQGGLGTSISEQGALGRTTCTQKAVLPSGQRVFQGSTWTQGTLEPSASAPGAFGLTQSAQAELRLARITQDTRLPSVSAKGSLGLVTSSQRITDTPYVTQGDAGISQYSQVSLESSPSKIVSLDGTLSDQGHLKQATSTKGSLDNFLLDQGEVGTLKDTQINLEPSLSTIVHPGPTPSSPGDLEQSTFTQQTLVSSSNADGALGFLDQEDFKHCLSDKKRQITTATTCVTLTLCPWAKRARELSTSAQGAQEHLRSGKEALESFGSAQGKLRLSSSAAPRLATLPSSLETLEPLPSSQETLGHFPPDLGTQEASPSAKATLKHSHKQEVPKLSMCAQGMAENWPPDEGTLENSKCTQLTSVPSPSLEGASGISANKQGVLGHSPHVQGVLRSSLPSQGPFSNTQETLHSSSSTEEVAQSATNTRASSAPSSSRVADVGTSIYTKRDLGIFHWCKGTPKTSFSAQTSQETTTSTQGTPVNSQSSETLHTPSTCRQESLSHSSSAQVHGKLPLCVHGALKHSPPLRSAPEPLSSTKGLQRHSPSAEDTLGPSQSGHETGGSLPLSQRTLENSLSVQRTKIQLPSNTPNQELSLSIHKVLSSATSTQLTTTHYPAEQGTSYHSHYVSEAFRLGTCTPGTSDSSSSTKAACSISTCTQVALATPLSLEGAIGISRYTKGTLQPSPSVQATLGSSLHTHGSLGSDTYTQRTKVSLSSEETHRAFTCIQRTPAASTSTEGIVGSPTCTKGDLGPLKSGKHSLSTTFSAHRPLKRATYEQTARVMRQSSEVALRLPTHTQEDLSRSPPAQGGVKCSQSVQGTLASSAIKRPLGNLPSPQEYQGHFSSAKETMWTSQPAHRTLKEPLLYAQGSPEISPSAQKSQNSLPSTDRKLGLSESTQRSLSQATTTQGILAACLPSLVELGLCTYRQGNLGLSTSGNVELSLSVSTPGTLRMGTSTQRGKEYSPSTKGVILSSTDTQVTLATSYSSKMSLGISTHTQGTLRRSPPGRGSLGPTIPTHGALGADRDEERFRDIQPSNKKSPETSLSHQGTPGQSLTTQEGFRSFPAHEKGCTHSAATDMDAKHFTSTKKRSRCAHYEALDQEGFKNYTFDKKELITSLCKKPRTTFTAQCCFTPYKSSHVATEAFIYAQGCGEHSLTGKGTLGPSSSAKEQRRPPKSVQKASVHLSTIPVTLGRSPSVQGTVEHLHSAKENSECSLPVPGPLGHLPSAKRELGLSISAEGAEGSSSSIKHPVALSTAAKCSIITFPSHQKDNRHSSSPNVGPMRLKHDPSAQGDFIISSSEQKLLKTSFTSQSGPNPIIAPQGNLTLSPSAHGTLRPLSSLGRSLDPTVSGQRTLRACVSSEVAVEPSLSTEGHQGNSTSAQGVVSSDNQGLRHPSPLTKSSRLSSSTNKTLRHSPSAQGDFQISPSNQDIRPSPSAPKEIKSASSSRMLIRPTSALQSNLTPSKAGEDELKISSCHEEYLKYARSLQSEPRHSPFTKTQLIQDRSEQGVIRSNSSSKKRKRQFPSPQRCSKYMKTSQGKAASDKRPFRLNLTHDEGLRPSPSSQCGSSCCNPSKPRLRHGPSEQGDFRHRPSNRVGLGVSPSPQKGSRYSTSTKMQSRHDLSEQKDFRHSAHQADLGLSPSQQREQRHSSSTQLRCRHSPTQQMEMRPSHSHKEELRQSSSSHRDQRHCSSTKTSLRHAPSEQRVVRTTCSHEEGLRRSPDPHRVHRHTTSSKRKMSHDLSPRRGVKTSTSQHEEFQTSMSAKRRCSSSHSSQWGFGLVHDPSQQASDFKQGKIRQILSEHGDLRYFLSYKRSFKDINSKNGDPKCEPSVLGGHQYSQNIRHTFQRMPQDKRRWRHTFCPPGGF